MNQLTLNEIILEQANKCVVCGLCLPECPTFNESRREAQSPRGRIALAKALAEDSLPASKTLLSSLAGCLLCRACEQACPSKVGFRKMMLAARSVIKKSFKSKAELPAIVHVILYLARKPKRYSLLVTIYKKSGLRQCLKKTRILKLLGLDHIDALLPASQSAVDQQRDFLKPRKPSLRLGLFTGCMSQSLDSQTIHSVHQVFNALGIELVTANRALCCGGLHNSSVNEFQAAFPADIKTIISCVSGCTAELIENTVQHSAENNSGNLTGGKNLLDVSAFLIQQNFEQIKFRPCEGVIAVHEPCSLRYPLAAEEFVYSLLNNIPGARITAMPENNKCCGGAGDYLFRQPVMAKKLRDNKLRVMGMMQPALPDIIVTSNLGCAMNLQAGLRDQNRPIEIMHPVTLLARQLEHNENEG